MTSRASLEERFTHFLKSLSGAESIDELLSSGQFKDRRRADFFIRNREVIVELKTLKSDTSPKVKAELEKHRNRSDYPLQYGPVDLEDVLKHLPDGQEINRTIYLKVTRSVQDAVRSAEGQIADTRDIFQLKSSIGMLVLLNESIDILNPAVVAKRVQDLILRNDISKGKENSINCAWLIFESHTVKSNTAAIEFISVFVEGRHYNDLKWFDVCMEGLQAKWARFNGGSVGFSPAKIGKLKFRSKQSDKLPAAPRSKHEYWQMQYEALPYMRPLSDEEVLSRGAAIFRKITPYMLIGGPRISPEEIEPMWIVWSDFLQEARFRGLNLRNFHTK